jgi:glycosyltransferase involved in cell wall biosynthesis
LKTHTREICPGQGEPGLVSVIIPTYNRAYIVGHAVDSVLAQTYSNIEIIIVDDGSTDDTRSVIAKYDSRVRYAHQNNGGVPAARNHGFSLARGEFIALLDSDDAWHPNKLELQIAFMRKHPEVGMVWTDMTAIRDDGSRVADTYLRKFYNAYQRVRIEEIMQPAGKVRELGIAVEPHLAEKMTWIGNIFSPLIRGTLVHTPTTMLRRDRVRGTGGYDESLRPTGEDFDFHLRTAVQGPVGFLDIPTIDYRIGNEDQLTAPSFGLAMSRIYMKTVEKWIRQERRRITLSEAEIRAILAYANRWTGAQELMNGSRPAARKHLWRSLAREPADPRTAALFVISLLPSQVATGIRALRHKIRRN